MLPSFHVMDNSQLSALEKNARMLNPGLVFESLYDYKSVKRATL